MTSLTLDRLAKDKDGYLSPKLRELANKALALANRALINVPYPFSEGANAKLIRAFKSGFTLFDKYEKLNQQAVKLVKYQGVAGLRLASSEDEIKIKAQRFAKECDSLLDGIIKIKHEDGELNKDTVSDILHAAYDALSCICEREGITPADLKRRPSPNELYSACLRMAHEKWWRRRITRAHRRWVEHTAIKYGFVGKHANHYVSDQSLAEYKHNKKRNRQLLESIVAYNEELQLEVDLVDCVDASTANPVNRRNELMMRIRGLAEYAQDVKEWGAQFWTVTAPSRFHRYTNGQDNSRYNGASPIDAQAWLNARWQRIRAALKREGLACSGLRVAEPHKDGCPHWHILFFAAPEDLERIEEIASQHFLWSEDFESEQEMKDRLRHGFDVKDLDWEQENPVAYVAKYISKNIDGKTAQGELFEDGAAEPAERVNAWASIWGIRQFQFFSAGKVGIWREVRRIRGIPTNEGAEAIQDFWSAANSEAHGGEGRAEWKDFMQALDSHPISLVKRVRTADVAGSILSRNDYEEVLEDIVGIECGGITYFTRLGRWKLAERAKFCAPWSCDNNCTPHADEFSRERIKKGYPPD